MVWDRATRTSARNRTSCLTNQIAICDRRPTLRRSISAPPSRAQFDIDRGVQPTPETQRIEAYLQRIADSLGKHAHRQLPWRIHFDPHPGIKSGFALPGGHIVIWGGILAYMSTEDEAAAVIAHEIEHIDDGQVTRRIDSLVRTQHRDVNDPKQWKWDEFGASYGETLENLCDYKGAKLAVAAGYSPYAYKTDPRELHRVRQGARAQRAAAEGNRRPHSTDRARDCRATLGIPHEDAAAATSRQRLSETALKGGR